MKQGQHVPVGNDLNRDQDSLETRLYDPDVKKVVPSSWASGEVGRSRGIAGRARRTRR